MIVALVHLKYISDLIFLDAADDEVNLGLKYIQSEEKWIVYLSNFTLFLKIKLQILKMKYK